MFRRPRTCAPVRHLSAHAPRQEVLRTSSRLASSSSHRHALRRGGEEDARCVQPTSATQSNCVHPHLVRSQFLTPLSQRGRPAETRLRATSGGPDVSRRPRPLRRIVIERETLMLYCLTAWSHERGRCLPAALMMIEPLTSLSRSAYSPSRLICLRRCCNLWPCVLLLKGLARVGGWSGAPRSPWSPSRESRRFVMIRDAFHRQGLFIGSGGHYSPGPASVASLLAIFDPPDGDLSPP